MTASRSWRRERSRHSQWLEDLRPPTFAIAYRMLGSVAEAEDVVQETLLRVHRALVAEERIESLRAYAATIATRLAIDQLRSARVRRETYVGEWLPEPIVTDPASDPGRQAEMADSLSLAFLVLLESLSPEQRAALLLRDVFDYGYDEIAEIVGTSEVNARQLATRARRHVERAPAALRGRAGAARRARRALLRGGARGRPRRARGAARAGRRAARRRRRQGARARALAARPRPRRAHARSRGRARASSAAAPCGPTDVNGQPGALVLDADGGLIGVMPLDVADGQIQGVRSIVNPEKIGHVGRVGEHARAARPPAAVSASAAVAIGPRRSDRGWAAIRRQPERGPMSRTRIAQLVLVVAVGMTALSGCGGDSDDDGAAAPARRTRRPRRRHGPGARGDDRRRAAAADSGGSGAVTAAGSTLTIGQAATIAYDDASKHLKSTITVAPTKIEKGSIGDFKNINLDADQKTATPYYAEVTVRNIGKGNLTGTDPAGYIDGVDDRGQRQNEIIFFGDFDRCDGSDPKSLKPGESYDTCLTYLIPKGGSIVGMRWIFFDQKTGKSDINWK